MTKTRGSPDPVDEHPGKNLRSPPNLPRTFLYFGVGKYLGHFDVLIRQYGIRIQHTHAVVCPCTTVNDFGGTGNPDPDCSACFGRGVAFVETDTDEFVGVVTGVSDSERTIDRGSIVEGEVQITAPSQKIMDSGDRVVFPDSVVPIKFVRKYKASVGGFVLPFRVSFPEVVATKGPRSEDPIVSLVSGKDYTVNPKKRLMSFPPETRVTDGAVVSATFIGTPDYVIDRAVHSARGRLDSLDSDSKHIQFPRTYTAVRADLYMGQDQDEVSGSGDVRYR